MPVDFFAIPCNNPLGNCQTEPTKCLQFIPNNSFGISDVNGGNNLPAVVNAINPNPDTELIVANHSKTAVRFKAIDWCTDIFRTGTYSLADEHRDTLSFSSDDVDTYGQGLIKRCEGFLEFNETIVFIEIKNRSKSRGGWLKDAREKFEETILSFKEHHPVLAVSIGKPILCNPSFKGPHSNETIQKKILKDKIGKEFVRQDEIGI